MLREIDRSIWVAEQPFRYFGLGVGTRMTVIRLANQELAVISPIQFSDALVDQLDKLGTIRHVVAPNLYHYLFVADFKKAYPGALAWAVPGLEVKKPDLPIDRIIGKDVDFLQNEVEFVFFEGFRTIGLTGFDSLNECVFFHAASRTLILTDTAFNFDESFPMTTRLLTQVFGGYKQLSPSILERVATTEKKQVKRSVEKVLSWDFERVIMAHGSIVERNGKDQFKRGYEQFLGQSVSAVDHFSRLPDEPGP